MKKTIYGIGELVRVKLNYADYGAYPCAEYDGRVGAVSRRKAYREPGMEVEGHFYEIAGFVSEDGIPFAFADTWLRRARKDVDYGFDDIEVATA